MELSTAIQQLCDRVDLTAEQMTAVMRQIMTGVATPAQIGGFLIGLRMKGETVTEITAAAQVMREFSTPVKLQVPHLVDTCGTGGDGAKTFNISTASAFVIAAAGGRVAKHGNRSVSSRSGSADVLEAAGINLNRTPEQVALSIEQTGVGFLFAPSHHPAMKYASGPRKEMGVRTLFNVLGPLTNPASAPNQVLGVFSPHWLWPLAEVLQRLGSQHVLVVHAADGLDEISIAGPTDIVELQHGELQRYTIDPTQFGLPVGNLADLAVTSAAHSLATIHAIFANQPPSPAARDIVILNAGAGIYAANLSITLAQGIEQATALIASGAAQHQWQQFIQFNRL